MPPSGDPQPSCPSGALLKDTPARGQSWQHGVWRGVARWHLGWERFGVGDGAAPVVCPCAQHHAWRLAVLLGWALGRGCVGDGTVPQSLGAMGKARCRGSGCSSVLQVGAWGLTVGQGSLCRCPLSWQHCGLPASLRHSTRLFGEALGRIVMRQLLAVVGTRSEGMWGGMALWGGG